MKTKKRPSYLTKVRARSDADTRGWFNASGPQVVALPPLSVAMGHFGCSGANFERWVPGKGPFSHFGFLLLHTTLLKRSRHSMSKNTWNKGNETGKGAFLAAQPVRNGHARSFRRSSSSTLVGCLTDHVTVALQQVRSLEFKKQFPKTRGRWECRESVARCEKPKPKLVASPRCPAILETEVL